MEDAKDLYLMDLNRLSRLNLAEFERNKDDPPSFEIVFNFHEANLPVGMGLFTLDDNDSGSDPAVYVVGGEKISVIPETCYPWNCMLRSDTADRIQFLDQSYGDGGMGRQVYRLEPNSSSSSSKNKRTGKNAQKIIAVESSTIPHMISPKPNALTAKIDGKVYVMANEPYFYTRRCPFRTFEVYDPVANSWEALEDCPFDPLTFVPNALFVLNHWLIVHNMQLFYIYDVDKGVWLDAGNTNFIHRHFSCFPSFGHRVPPPYLSGKVATYEDVTVAYTGSTFHGVVVYFPASNVGPKHQRLDELKLDFPFDSDDESPYHVGCTYDPHFNHFRVGNIFHLGGGKMCFFCTVCNHTHVMVTIFQLKLQRSGMHYCSASADILRSHSYHLHEPLGYFGFIREPFVMGELFDICKSQDDVRNASSKRQRVLQPEALDVDASSERLQTNSH